VSRLVRVPLTASIVMSHTFFQDGVGTDASGPVTWARTRLDGTAVDSGTAAVGTVGDGIYTFNLPPSAVLDTHIVDWTGSYGGAPFTARDFVEFVGGHLFGLTEARNMPPALNVSVYPWAMLAERRIAVEDECEQICQVAMVPRFKRRVLDGTGTPDLVTPDLMLRAVRAISVNGVAYTSPQLAAVGFTDSGIITLDTGYTATGVWPRGRRNVIVEYEHGLDYPPTFVAEAGMLRLRDRLGLSDTSTPTRAISWTTTEGGTYRLTLPSKQKTGHPDVDAAYESASLDRGGFA
jgi:hypothetical protein